jgi:hypothetical protein
MISHYAPITRPKGRKADDTTSLTIRVQSPRATPTITAPFHFVPLYLILAMFECTIQSAEHDRKTRRSLRAGQQIGRENIVLSSIAPSHSGGRRDVQTGHSRGHKHDGVRGSIAIFHKYLPAPFVVARRREGQWRPLISSLASRVSCSVVQGMMRRCDHYKVEKGGCREARTDAKSKGVTDSQIL